MSSNPKYSDITPEVHDLADLFTQNSNIDPALYTKYDVKRGLRDISGKGVLAGLTEIAEVRAYEMEGDKLVPILSWY